MCARSSVAERSAHNRLVVCSMHTGRTTFGNSRVAPWSSGLRHRPFKAVTRVRVPLGPPDSRPRTFSEPDRHSGRYSS